MSIVPETKACESCARSKRKCGKETPRCHRCASRNLACSYPPARPSSFVLLQDDPPSATCTPQMSPAAHLVRDTSDNNENDRTPDTLLGTPELWDPSAICPLPDFDEPFSACNNATDIQPGRLTPPAPPKNLSCDWFLSPHAKETMGLAVVPPKPHSVPPYNNGVLKHFLKSVRTNLADWVYKGENNFIHRQLYTFRNPRCVQDAQGTLALYLARTDETEDTVFRTLNERANQLLADEEKHNTTSSLDTFGHLARVHSLLTYHIIGLLDGDIQLRAKAEERTNVLNAWVTQMIESLRFASSLLSGSAGGKNMYAVMNVLGLGIKDLFTPEQVASCTESQQEIVWQAWALTESLRRTWVTVEGLGATYHALRRGWASCTAGMLLTSRQGVWDARSRNAWAQIVMKKDLWVIDGRYSESLFSLARPDEVDAFTKLCMEISYGRERMEKWEAGTAC